MGAVHRDWEGVAGRYWLLYYNVICVVIPTLNKSLTANDVHVCMCRTKWSWALYEGESGASAFACFPPSPTV